MPEEWFELAFINFDKAILHGRIMAGMDEFRVRREAYVEQVLTAEQRAEVEQLSIKHNDEMQRLLAGLVDRDAALSKTET